MLFRALPKQSLNRAISVFSWSAVSVFSIDTAVAAAEIKQLEVIHVSAETSAAESEAYSIALQGFAVHDLREVPAAISTINTAMLDDQQAKGLSDVLKHDAAFGDGYAAIGYYPNAVSRGFALDLSSSYLINGQPVRGEQTIALENKQRVELLKGLAAIQSGLSTPGGVINYVTKRPEQIRQLTLQADSHAASTIALDIGGFWGQQQQWGYRVNAAAENLNSYVDHADGKRFFGSLAIDWLQSDHAGLQFDLETQYQQQRSVPGYQLLDGLSVPKNVDRNRLLGYQSWSEPVTMRALTAQLKYYYDLATDWRAEFTASHSQVVMDDNSAFPWGCYAEHCQYSGLGNSFDVNGTYDIYDYRVPDDTRQTTQIQASVTGRMRTGSWQHQLRFDLSQTDKQRKRYQGINQVIGTGNIYQDSITYAAATELDMGPRYKALDSQQSAVAFIDRIEFNRNWSTLLGAKWVDVDEKAYAATGEQTRNSDFSKFLPQLAVMYSPWQDSLVYASYAKGLADGSEAPWYTENASQVLAPVQSRQYELGLKQQIGSYLLTLALFDLKQDNHYSRADANGDLWFVAQGKQHNQGIEVGSQGQISEHLQLSTSLAYIYSRLQDLDSVALQQHQTQNVPKLRFSTHLSYQVAAIDGLRLLASMQASSAKNANKEGTAQVAGYSVFDVGAVYQFKRSGYDSTMRLSIENLFNKLYWRDAGGFMGDDYLFLGAARTAKVSLQINF